MAQTENLTVMFTDIVGFTERTSLQSRAQNQAMLADHNRLLLPLIGRFGGRRIKSIGDALLITFRSPTDAVHCGMALHDALAEYNGSRTEPEQLHIRVAINVGEVRVDARDIFGEAVNVASRVEGLTPADQIYFTEAVYLAMNKAEVPSLPVGRFKLKGIPEEVNLFQVPARQVQRLMPGGEDLGALPGELPYGGMHRMPAPQTGVTAWVTAARNLQVPAVGPALQSRLDALRTLPSRRRLLAWGAALAATLALALLPPLFTRVVPPGVEAAAPSVAAADEATPTAPGRETQLIDPVADQRRVAQEWLTKGHDAFEQNRRRDAVPAYAQALSLDNRFQNDATLAKRLVECLSWASDLSMPVIRQYPSPAIIAALADRTGQPGDLGASRAAGLLTELGHADLIDSVTVAIADLKAAQSCEQKKSAIGELARSRSPRGVPILKETLGSGVQAWFKNRCFRSEAQKAIEEIEKAHPGAAGAART